MKNQGLSFITFFIYSIILFLTFGCSWFSKANKDDMVELPVPRILSSVTQPKPAKREPGSLWSEDSKWNDIYSMTPARQAGDVIMIKVENALKAQIARVVAAKTGKKVEDIKAAGLGINPEAAVVTREPASRLDEKKTADKVPEAPPPVATKKDHETKKVEATILEVLPRGLYRISANQGLHVGGPEEPFVALEGNVREREVAADDSVSSDALIGVKLDVVDYSKPNVVVGDKKVEAQGEKK